VAPRRAAQRRAEPRRPQRRDNSNQQVTHQDFHRRTQISEVIRTLQKKRRDLQAKLVVSFCDPIWPASRVTSNTKDNWVCICDHATKLKHIGYFHDSRCAVWTGDPSQHGQHRTLVCGYSSPFAYSWCDRFSSGRSCREASRSWLLARSDTSSPSRPRQSLFALSWCEVHLSDKKGRSLIHKLDVHKCRLPRIWQRNTGLAKRITWSQLAELPEDPTPQPKRAKP